MAKNTNPTSQKYDDALFYARRLLVLATTAGAITVAGTAAADTELLRLRLPVAMNIDEIDLTLITGGTAAGPTIQVGKSAAGTGTFAAFCTHAFNTSADDTGVGLTVAATAFADGDHLIVKNIAGTVAATPVVNFAIGWTEEFV